MRKCTNLKIVKWTKFRKNYYLRKWLENDASPLSTTKHFISYDYRHRLTLFSATENHWNPLRIQSSVQRMHEKSIQRPSLLVLANTPLHENRTIHFPFDSKFENCRQPNLTVRTHETIQSNVMPNCANSLAHILSFVRSLSLHFTTENAKVRIWEGMMFLYSRRENRRHSTHLLAQYERYWCRKPSTRFSSVSTIERHVSLPSVRSQINSTKI